MSEEELSSSLRKKRCSLNSKAGSKECIEDCEFDGKKCVPDTSVDPIFSKGKKYITFTSSSPKCNFKIEVSEKTLLGDYRGAIRWSPLTGKLHLCLGPILMFKAQKQGEESREFQVFRSKVPLLSMFVKKSISESLAAYYAEKGIELQKQRVAEMCYKHPSFVTEGRLSYPDVYALPNASVSLSYNELSELQSFLDKHNMQLMDLAFAPTVSFLESEDKQYSESQFWKCLDGSIDEDYDMCLFRGIKKKQTIDPETNSECMNDCVVDDCAFDKQCQKLFSSLSTSCEPFRRAIPKHLRESFDAIEIFVPSVRSAFTCVHNAYFNSTKRVKVSRRVKEEMTRIFNEKIGFVEAVGCVAKQSGSTSFCELYENVMKNIFSMQVSTGEETQEADVDVKIQELMIQVLEAVESVRTKLLSGVYSLDILESENVFHDALELTNSTMRKFNAKCKTPIECEGILDTLFVTAELISKLVPHVDDSFLETPDDADIGYYSIMSIIIFNIAAKICVAMVYQFFLDVERYTDASSGENENVLVVLDQSLIAPLNNIKYNHFIHKKGTTSPFYRKKGDTICFKHDFFTKDFLSSINKSLAVEKECFSYVLVADETLSSSLRREDQLVPDDPELFMTLDARIDMAKRMFSDASSRHNSADTFTNTVTMLVAGSELPQKQSNIFNIRDLYTEKIKLLKNKINKKRLKGRQATTTSSRGYGAAAAPAGRHSEFWHGRTHGIAARRSGGLPSLHPKWPVSPVEPPAESRDMFSRPPRMASPPPMASPPMASPPLKRHDPPPPYHAAVHFPRSEGSGQE